jgi:hypothetical protein
MADDAHEGEKNKSKRESHVKRVCDECTKIDSGIKTKKPHSLAGLLGLN